jgi:hypothetical protein
VVSIAISHGDVAALNYFIADKYVRAFGDLARSPNQKVPMMPYEASALLGSLAWDRGDRQRRLRDRERPATCGAVAAAADRSGHRAAPGGLGLVREFRFNSRGRTAFLLPLPLARKGKKTESIVGGRVARGVLICS